VKRRKSTQIYKKGIRSLRPETAASVKRNAFGGQQPVVQEDATRGKRRDLKLTTLPVLKTASQERRARKENRGGSRVTQTGKKSVLAADGDLDGKEKKEPCEEIKKTHDKNGKGKKR